MRNLERFIHKFYYKLTCLGDEIIINFHLNAQIVFVKQTSETRIKKK